MNVSEFATISASEYADFVAYKKRLAKIADKVGTPLDSTMPDIEYLARHVKTMAYLTAENLHGCLIVISELITIDDSLRHGVPSKRNLDDVYIDAQSLAEEFDSIDWSPVDKIISEADQPSEPEA